MGWYDRYGRDDVPLGEIPRDDMVEFDEEINFSAIPLNYEKFVSFNIGDLRFDSFQFMGSSLDKLTGNLYDKQDN